MGLGTAVKEAAVRMKLYCEQGIELKKLAPETKVDLKVGSTQDGRVILLFGTPIPDLIFTIDEAKAFLETAAQAVADAQKVISRHRP